MVTDINRELPMIIAEAKAGDAGACGELYRRYASQILRYLYARLREPESAQDLTQEVFVRVIKGIGGFEYRGEKSFLGWLYTIAGNVLIGQARRKQLISTPLDEQVNIIDPQGQAAVQSIFDRITLNQALHELTEDQQQVLVLKFFADMTNNEIAQTLGRSEGAVKALQHRALHALHSILERQAQEQHSEPGARLNDTPWLINAASHHGDESQPVLSHTDVADATLDIDATERAKRARGAYRGP